MIILTRPAIEAGEKLGFLPGDLQSKVDPYLRPLYDALYQIMGADGFAKNMEKRSFMAGWKARLDRFVFAIPGKKRWENSMWIRRKRSTKPMRLP